MQMWDVRGKRKSKCECGMLDHVASSCPDSRSDDKDLRPECEAHGNGSGETEPNENIRATENDNLVDSDYEMNEGNVYQTQLTRDTKVNIDTRFGDLHEYAVQDTDTDCGESDELECLDNDEELPSSKRSREFEFNARVDMSNPQFKNGTAYIIYK
ncbi:hypothetical protein Fot_41240 [Forsythia ovata]|uniref:Uncharacterized protein n=1 Tax=Forsythia ovata TaxID=205694 RepID=A0ABD1RHW8_9LAMI